MATGDEQVPAGPTGVVVRAATRHDVDAILAVQEPAAVVALGHIFPQDKHPFPRSTVADRWLAELADGSTAVYVCVAADGSITGFAARREDELLHFGTALEWWGTGLAQQLHDAVVSTFPFSVRRIRLRVLEDDHRARRFYEKLGWAATGFTSKTQFPPFPVLIEYVLARDP